MYSTLRCGMKLYQLSTSSISPCSQELEHNLQRIGEYVFGLGLRNYLTCHDSIKAKRQAIEEIVAPLSTKANIFTRSATMAPGTFSLLSNLTSLFLPALLVLRRKWKYKSK